jgi:hypothetical protein
MLRTPRLIALLRIRGAQNPLNLVAILNEICIFRGALEIFRYWFGEICCRSI